MAGRSQQKETYPERIQQIRESLGLNQTEFADLIGVKQPTVSAWETPGSHRPSAEAFIEIAKKARDDEDKLWCWDEAGLPLRDLVPVVEKKQSERVTAPAPGQLVGIPAFGKTGGASGRSVFLPVEFVPHPLSTYYMIAGKASAGRPGSRHAQAPFLDEGDLIIVDTSSTDPRALWGKIVLLQFGPKKERRGYTTDAWPQEDIWVGRIGHSRGGDYLAKGRYRFSIHADIVGWDDEITIGGWEQEDHGKPDPDAVPTLLPGCKILGGYIALIKADSR